MFSSALLILSGNAAAAFISLLRNFLIARMISVENYGIAATFAIAMTVVEMISAFGLQQQIIQSKDGNKERVQASLQAFQLFRGTISALVLFFSADAMANFMNIPQATDAYRWLALVPLLNGAAHMDIHRFNRKMVYLPGILTNTGPMLLSLIAVWPLVLLYGDFRVMLVALLIQGVLTFVMSHVVAERKYTLAFDREILGRALRFGWPLLINNVLLFLVLNGEKLIVGREVNIEALAILAMGFTLTLTPTLVIAKSAQSFFLPQLSSVQDDDMQFQQLARTVLAVNFLNGVILLVVIALIGPPIVLLVLGEKYAALAPLMMWLAVLNALRVFKAGGAVIGLARAKTENAMVSNMPRVLSLPFSWWVATTTGDLMIVIWIGIAGEAVGVLLSLALVRWRTGVDLRSLWPMFAALVLMLCAAVVHALQVLLPPSVTALVCVAAAMIFLTTMTDLYRYIKSRNILKFKD